MSFRAYQAHSFSARPPGFLAHLPPAEELKPVAALGRSEEEQP